MSSRDDHIAIWPTPASKWRLGWMATRLSVVVPGSEGADYPHDGSWISHVWHRPAKHLANRLITGFMLHVVSRSGAPTTWRRLERSGWSIWVATPPAVIFTIPQPPPPAYPLSPHPL